jgi:hypothetical protein
MSEMDQEWERMKNLLKAALPRVGEDAEPRRDLWPDVLRQMSRGASRVPWFDWALAAGLIALAAAFPSAIPVLLYYM